MPLETHKLAPNKRAMALRGKVKISSVNNLSDARYVAGMGVEYMGFEVDPSAEYRISATDFNAITGWVSGVQLVGQVNKIEPVLLEQLLEDYTLDLVEVTDPEGSDLNQLVKPYAIYLQQPELSDLHGLMNQWSGAEYFLINTPYISEPKWQLVLADLVRDFPILLGGDLNQQQAVQWLERGAIGVELQGGDEIKPGYKDFDDLADILEALEIDDIY